MVVRKSATSSSIPERERTVTRYLPSAASYHTRWPLTAVRCYVLDRSCLHVINSNTEEGSLAGGASCLLGNSMPVAVGRQWAGKE